MKICVSACLTGENCKYNGKNNRNEKLVSFIQGHEVLKVCPEVLGGLPIPRIPCEIKNGHVVNREGESCDYEFRQGAKLSFEKVEKFKPDMIVLQSRSPSCGVKQIYSGEFNKTLIDGSGVFAKLLIENGYKPIDIEDL